MAALAYNSMNTTFDTLSTLLVRTFNLPPERLTPDASLAALDIDSLGTVELLWQVEEVFKVKLPAEPVAMLTLADVVVFIDGLVAQRRALAAQQPLQPHLPAPPLPRPLPHPPAVNAVLPVLPVLNAPELQ